VGADSSSVENGIAEKSSNEKFYWRLIFLLAIVGRAVAALVEYKFSRIPGFSIWGYENIAIATSLHAGHGFSSPFFTDSGPTAFMAPGYPLLLAGIMAIFGPGSLGTTMVVVLQEILSLAMVLLVLYIARRQFGVRTAHFAGLLCALMPQLVLAPVRIWDTSLSAFALTGIFAAANGPLLPRMRFIPAGAVCALAGLVNPALIPSLWAICGWSAWKAKTIPWLGMLTFLVVFSPWPIRNAVVMHAFIPLRTDFGYELWMGNHPGGNGDFDETMNPMMSEQERHAFVAQGELPYLHEKGVLARTFIAAHPAMFLAWTLKRLGQFWMGAEPALIGLLVLAWRKNGQILLYGLPILLFPLPYYITIVSPRFQYIIDPLLTILAAHVLDFIFSWWRPRREVADREEVQEPI
jgi:4-amino-4-deoxy-L-arabinose transferase-like glycosyltransferase